MKLFSKKNGKQKTAAPKKSLLGKKSVASATDSTAPAKKTGFGLGKKPAKAHGIPPMQGGKNAKAKGMDTAKLIPILGGLIALILLALVAKMFLFNEPEPEPIVPTLPPPSQVQPQIEQPAQATVEAPAQDVQPAQTAAPQPQLAQEAQPQPIQDNSQMIVAPTAHTPKSFTKDEFLQEAKNKIYIERDTAKLSPEVQPSQ